MKITNKIHYVYKITNLHPTDERLYYIGVRSTSKASAEIDTSYQSSSNYLKQAIIEIGHDKFNKEILSEWKTRKLALKEEIRLHNKFDVAKNPLFYNKSKQTNTGFDTSGFMAVKNTDTNEIIHVSVEEFEITSKYISVLAASISVRDNRDNKTKRVSVEDFKMFDHYISLTKNRVTVIDTLTGETCSISTFEYKSNSRYQRPNKGMVSIIDTRDGTGGLVSKLDYEKFNYYVHIRTKKYNIYDSNGVIQFKVYGNFRKFCVANNLPPEAFIKSQSNGGSKLYQSDNAYPKEKYKKFKGWYAKISK